MSASRIAMRAASTAATGFARPVRVTKFGGSSVGSADAFRRVAAHLSDLHADGNHVVAVLSAMYGVTDKLIGAFEAARSGRDADVSRARDLVWELHHSTVSELLPHGPVRDEVLEGVAGDMEKHFDTHCTAALEGRAEAADAYDAVASLGERLSNAVMAGYLEQGHREGASAPGQYVAADDVIVTDGVQSGATPVLDASSALIQERVAPLLEDGAIPCVTGFMGRGPQGNVTTFGRGGSDLTAAVLGYALDAEEVALYKVESTADDRGFLSTWESGWVGVVHDANVAETIDYLAYEEAAELAHFGKKVLHPATVNPAVAKGIAVTVKNTLEPNNPGTTIGSAAAAAGDAPVRAVTKIDLTEYEAKSGATLAVQPAELDAQSRDDVALVALVGVGVADALPHDTVLDALDARGIPAVVPPRVNGSPNNLTIAVPMEHKKEAVKAVHDVFVA